MGDLREDTSRKVGRFVLYSDKEKTALVNAIEDCLESDKLNDWESGFLEDIQKAFRMGRRITEVQDEKLKEIIER